VVELVKTMVETSQGCLVSVVSLTVGFRHSRKLVKGEVALLVDDPTLKFLLRHQEVGTAGQPRQTSLGDQAPAPPRPV